MNQLERDKPHLILDTSVDLEHCEKFALSVYIKAKRRDEQGVSDRDTAKAYYAAFNFIEVCLLTDLHCVSVWLDFEAVWGVVS